MSTTPRPLPPLTLRLWLLTGALAIIVFPEARGYHALIGWLPFWLLLAPLASLAVWRLLHGAAVGPRRRRQARRRQTRQARRSHPWRQPHAA
ncbi:MAG TPA: hypothetical protein PKZ76_08390 [Xanthomonadaceae bacterium]|nr:hypothetical protein [Xanthomonadaceae bacterium]